MFDRGHLDHLALTAATPEAFATIRERLVARGATDGAVEDLGAFHSVWFDDPDGMRVELVLIVDERLQGIHAPQPLERCSQQRDRWALTADVSGPLSPYRSGSCPLPGVTAGRTAAARRWSRRRRAAGSS